MDIINTLLATIGIEGVLLIVVGLWLFVAIIKKLFKLALVAGIVLLFIYYVYPLLTQG